MTKDEALRLALEALENVRIEYDFHGNPLDQDNAKIAPAITALRQAIEQAEKNQFNPDWDAMAVMVEEQQRMAKRIEELEQAEKQEPVAWICYGAPGKRDIDFEESDINKLPIGTLLYTTPPAPQREWVGLTVDECVAIGVATGLEQTAIYMIEAKLKEKNT